MRWRRRKGGPVALGIATLVAVMAATFGTPGAEAAGPQSGGPVVAWARHHAQPLRTADPGDPLDDLAPLRRVVGDARIVGLGEAAHGTAELAGLKHRAVRLLVERMGFRSLAWEEDWTNGVRIDTYIRTGKGDPDALVRAMAPQWSSAGEVADVLRWLRGFNARRPAADQVRFVGLESFMTRRLAYDAVADYVAATAPQRTDELGRLLDPLRPRCPDPLPPGCDDIWQHIAWYQGVEDKQPYVERARQVYDLIAGLPHRPGDRAHGLALHNARQIRSFYEFYALEGDAQNTYRDARAAENLRWWHHRTGDRIAYWAASAHTAVAPRIRLTQPPGPDLRFAGVGSYLRSWYGRGYRSIGFMLDHGAVTTGPGQTAELPPPAPGWFERPLGLVRADQYVLDLRRPAPPPVRRWLYGPITTRGPGPGSVATGGSAAQWFDAVVHRQEVTPSRPLT